jgi:aspartyl protease family protein
MAVEVSAAFGDMNVLGMNFLSSLSSWSVQGQWLVLKP